MAGSSATATAMAKATPKEAYDISGPLDPTAFYPKSGALPAVVEVRDQTGSWDTVGRTRKLMLSDGGHVIETITDTESPVYFAYELSDFQKLFGALVKGARAEWRFEREAEGTSIRWTYTFFGKPGRGWIVALIVKLLWGPYMHKVLPPIANEVSRQAAAKPAAA
ncbi:MAG: SRPBCC family protein [Actinobacteria bacterium]|nr:SRPBCC family protein [Actinomycetota bacterium]